MQVCNPSPPTHWESDHLFLFSPHISAWQKQISPSVYFWLSVMPLIRTKRQCFLSATVWNMDSYHSPGVHGFVSQFINTIDRDTLFSFKIDSSPFNLPFHLINHVMTATNTYILPLTTLWWWTLLCFMWGYSIGLNFKRQTSDHCMRTNYRGSWLPLFFLTNLLTWNLKCKFANQPSTFCPQVLMFVCLWMCAL